MSVSLFPEDTTYTVLVKEMAFINHQNVIEIDFYFRIITNLFIGAHLNGARFWN